MSRANYLTVTQNFALENACAILWKAFPNGGSYLVGSVLKKSDYRDVDIRTIIDDTDFQRLFPRDKADKPGDSWYWQLVNRSVSEWLSRMTSLPIDWQVQSQTEANKDHGERSAVGIRLFVEGKP